jgi:hypothetical protein
MLPSDPPSPPPKKNLPESTENLFQPQHERHQRMMNQMLDINTFKMKNSFYFGLFPEMKQRRSEFSLQVKSAGSQ